MAGRRGSVTAASRFGTYLVVAAVWVNKKRQLVRKVFENLGSGVKQNRILLLPLLFPVI